MLCVATTQKFYEPITYFLCNSSKGMLKDIQRTLEAREVMHGPGRIGMASLENAYREGPPGGMGNIAREDKNPRRQRRKPHTASRSPTRSPPVRTTNSITSATPCPRDRSVKTNGREPRMRAASRRITSRSTFT